MTTQAPTGPVTFPAQAAASGSDKGGTIAAHLTALISAAVGVIALVHPGFKEPASVQAVAAAIPFAVAGITEAVHLITHRSLKAALAAAWAEVEKALHPAVIVNKSGPAAPPAPTVPATPPPAPAAPGGLTQPLVIVKTPQPPAPQAPPPSAPVRTIVPPPIAPG